MIYISGPITGNQDAKRQFTRAETWLLNRFTQSVINPFYDFEGLEDTVGYSALVDICCRVAGKAEFVVVLPGWKESYGSCSEILAYLAAGGRIVRQLNSRGFPACKELIPPCRSAGQKSITAALKNIESNVDVLVDVCRRRIRKGPPVSSEK